MKTTEENNRMIAEFIGWKPYNGLNPKWNGSFDTNSLFPVNATVEKRELKFDTSWDWLMPVVEKIYSLEIEDELVLLVRDALAEANIKDTYQAVIQFIEWYNSQS